MPSSSNTYICHTLFHLYIAMLKCFQEEGNDTKNYLILTDQISDVDNLIERLEKITIITKVFLWEDNKMSFNLSLKLKRYKTNLVKYKYKRKYISEIFETNYEVPVEILKSEIYVFNDSSFIFAYLYHKIRHVNIIEDGARVYIPLRNKIIAYIKHYIFGVPSLRDGRYKKANTIEVVDPMKLPKDIIKKSKKLYLKNMEDNLNLESKRSIFDVFGFENVDIKSPDNNLLLITQPLSEDGIIDEKYKINLYNEVLKNYKQYNIFLKKHPREKTDYAGKLDFEFKQINQNFPLEILNLLNNDFFEYGITIKSSALTNLRCIRKKIELGYSYDKHLEARCRKIKMI